MRNFFSFILIMCFHFISFSQNEKKAVDDKDAVRTIITDFFKTQASVKYIYQCCLNADATKIVWCADGNNGQEIYCKSLVNLNDSVIKITAADSTASCNESEPQWSPDGKKIAFFSDAKSPNQLQLFIADAASGVLISKHPITNFNGYVSHLHWSPDGKFLSVLYVENATRNPSPMAAENKATGLIDSSLNHNVQRITIINATDGSMHFVSPNQLYVFEYDWSPDSKSFAYAAAPPPGDDNWYIAKLYTQNILNNDTVLLYRPTYQIALPRWSPDGKRITFIEGLMSDQGGTGGEIFLMNAVAGSKPKNLTSMRKSTPAWISWQDDDNILFSEFVGGSVAVSNLNLKNNAAKTLWQSDANIHASDAETSLSVIKKNSTIAFVSSSWNKLPEIFYGNFSQQTQLTNLNNEIQKPFLKTENIKWINEGMNVQGWLLFPSNYDSTKKYPMLVCVHGGPAWVTTPTWAAPDFNTTVYAQLGYFIFFPNPRGSYGQGEKFTLANRRDWGFGDLRDILGGIDILVKKYSIDNNRIGILGWSYGGSMAMISVTQTNRFKASVAGAGACNWQSYYGQNSIDKWMNSYFNASPYDDAEAYKKVSAITYIKNVKTPTLVMVGERDGESPPTQSFEFWHALKELNVPTQLYVYPDEGHEFEKFENMIDASVRTINWFNNYLK